MVCNIQQGLTSTFLRERTEPGTAMEFAGPSGSFYLREIRRPQLFLAGGTGLAPFLSMLGKIAETGAGGHPIHMVYGVTNDADLVGADQLEAFAARIPSSTFSICVAAAGELLLREVLPKQRGERHRRTPPAGGVRRRWRR